MGVDSGSSDWAYLPELEDRFPELEDRLLALAERVRVLEEALRRIAGLSPGAMEEAIDIAENALDDRVGEGE